MTLDSAVHWQHGDVVVVIAGDGDRRFELSARVLSADAQRPAFRLEITPLDPLALAPGVPLLIEHENGTLIQAVIDAVDADGVLRTRIASTPSAPLENQRRHFRAPMGLRDAQATLVKDSSTARFRVRLVDLSGGGARILAPRPLVTGNRISLTLRLHDGRPPLEVAGIIIWSRQLRRSWQAGVYFDGLREVDRDVIIRVVNFEEVRRP